MIFTEKKITINNNQCKIDSPVVLYRGDYNVEVRFTIVSSPYKYSNKQETNVIEQTEASYGQLVIKTPNNNAPIFSEITATKRGAITFTITAEMIDEISEVGDYTFQIRLLDENKESRATIPEVKNSIEIREPIATEDVTDTNEVDLATAGYAVTTAGETLDAFDENGNYNKTTWATGDRITAAKLDKIEAGIDGVNKKVASGGTGGTGLTTEQAQQLSTAYQHSQTVHVQESDIPTKTSDLTNDSDYVNSTYVQNKIAEASLSGGEVDLSGYVTKETGNANQITFSDGQTFQAKLDAGTLKGDKGDKGDVGPQGPQGIQGPAGTTTASGVSITDTANNFTATDVEGALQEVGSQIKDIANYSLTKGTDGLLYIKKQDGTLIGTGVEVGSGDVDLSTLSMSINGQTLKLLDGTTELATVEIPTAVVTDEQLTSIIQSKIDDGTLTSISLGEGSVKEVNVEDGAITPNKTSFFKEEYINFALNVGTLENVYNGTNPDYTKTITDYIDVRDNLTIYIKSWKMKLKGASTHKSEIACYNSEKTYLGMGTVSHIEVLTETDDTSTYYYWMNNATLLENTKYIRIGYNSSYIYRQEGLIVSSNNIESTQTVDQLDFSISANYYEALFNALIKDNSIGIKKINGTFTPSTTNFMIEDDVNMINPNEISAGKFFNSADTDSIGYFDPTSVTGYIEVELGGKYYFYRENTSLDSDYQRIVVRGYDANKNYLGILFGEHSDTSTAKGVREFQITDENVKFIRFFYRNGENVILSKYNLNRYYAYREYLSLDIPTKYKEFFIRNIMASEITKGLIKDNVSTVALEQNMRPLYNKKWVQIGDSLTDWGGGEHVDILSQDLSKMDLEGDTGFMRLVRDKEGILFYNQGYAGAQWQLTKIDGSISDNEGNPITSEPAGDRYSAVRRVDTLIANKANFTADIITILMGTNCADEGEVSDTSDNPYTMCGAIRYCLENLLREFPTTPIGILLPPQRLEGNLWQEPRNEKIKEIAHYYSIPVLDLFHEGQIVSANRVVVEDHPTSGNGSLTDGLHLGDVGCINLGRKLCNWLKTL